MANAGATRRAVGYLRCSTGEQARSGLGLAAQEERVRAYAVAAGLELVDIVRDEGVSGSTPIAERAGGRRVIETVRRREAGHVIALKLDRLFRDAVDCLDQTRAWDRAGVALHLIDMGGASINTSSAMGRMFLTMAAGFAELERNLIAERTASALQQKRRRGEKTGGACPYGFKLGADGVHLVVLEDEQEVISLVVKLAAAGHTLRAIGDRLAARGIAPRTGAWHHEKLASILRRAARDRAELPELPAKAA